MKEWTRARIVKFVELELGVDQVILLDGWERAFVGVLSDPNTGDHCLYNMPMIIDGLMKLYEMDYEEAVEFFDFNIRGLEPMDNGPRFCSIKERTSWTAPRRRRKNATKK